MVCLLMSGGCHYLSLLLASSEQTARCMCMAGTEHCNAVKRRSSRVRQKALGVATGQSADAEVGKNNGACRSTWLLAHIEGSPPPLLPSRWLVPRLAHAGQCRLVTKPGALDPSHQHWLPLSAELSLEQPAQQQSQFKHRAHAAYAAADRWWLPWSTTCKIPAGSPGCDASCCLLHAKLRCSNTSTAQPLISQALPHPSAWFFPNVLRAKRWTHCTAVPVYTSPWPLKLPHLSI